MLALFAGALPLPALAAVSLGNTSLLSGIVGYWPFNEGSGKVANSVEGASAPLAFTNSPTWVAGEFGAAVQFAYNANAYLSHSAILALDFGTGDFTVSFWMKPVSPWDTATTQGVVGQKTSDTTNGWQIYQDSGHPGHLDMRITQQHNFLTNAIVPVGQWTYVTFVRQSGTLYWYLNGTLDATSTDTSSISDSGAFYVGYAPTWEAYYTGAIDDLRIYSRALSPAEVAAADSFGAIRLAQPNLLAASRGLVGYWSMGGPTINWSTDTMADLSGRGNVAALINMSTSSSPVVGKLGSALYFNGSDNLSIASSSTFIPSTNAPLSISFWFKAATIPSASLGARLVNFHRGSTSGTTLAVALGNSDNLQFYNYTDASTVNWTATVNAGVWYYVTLVYNGSTYQRYLNGIADGSPVAKTLTAGGSFPVLIGTYDGYTQYFTGTIDDVRIYGRALSPSEVALLAALGTFRAGHSSASVVGSGLVGYWTFDGPSINWSANTMQDTSGGGDMATLVSLATTTSPVPGKTGQALAFNGSSSVVTAGTLSALTGTHSRTVSVWFKTTTTADQGLFDSGTTASNDAAFQMYTVGNVGVGTPAPATNPGGVDLTFWGDDIYAPIGIGAVADGKWHQLVATYDQGSNTAALYLDGVAESAYFWNGTSWSSLEAGPLTVITPNTMGNPIEIGEARTLLWGQGNTFFNGSIDSVRVYGRALSAQEILQLYRSGQ